MRKVVAMFIVFGTLAVGASCASHHAVNRGSHSAPGHSLYATDPVAPEPVPDMQDFDWGSLTNWIIWW